MSNLWLSVQVQRLFLFAIFQQLIHINRQGTRIKHNLINIIYHIIRSILSLSIGSIILHLFRIKSPWKRVFTNVFVLQNRPNSLLQHPPVPGSIFLPPTDICDSFCVLLSFIHNNIISYILPNFNKIRFAYSRLQKKKKTKNK